MPRILVIGGRSRVATRLRAHLPGDTRYVVRGNAERADELGVNDYADAPMADIECVIHCVGTSVGPAAMLNQVNHRLCEQVALRARSAKVRHFVRLSSFSVYGSAHKISRDTPSRPQNAYGRSMLAGDDTLLSLAGPDFSTIALRVPTMIAADVESKLKRLIRTVARTGVIAMPSTDICRSMLDYDQAAGLLAGLAAEGRGGTLFAADPEPFGYRMLRECWQSVAPPGVRLFACPNWALSAVRRVRPALHASLFEDSVLEPADNLCVEKDYPSTIRSIVSQLIMQESR